MKKADQIMHNNLVLDVLDDLQQTMYYFGEKIDACKLRTCKAEVFRTEGYIVLRSYDTIVACIGEQDGVCYDFLRYVYGYSATSAQHISKFCKLYNCSKKITYHPV